jgi:hypothetical protein
MDFAGRVAVDQLVFERASWAVRPYVVFSDGGGLRSDDVDASQHLGDGGDSERHLLPGVLS